MKILKKIASTSLIVVMLAIMALPLIPALPVSATAGWLGDYNYRRQFTIDGTTAGLQTNYQMRLVVHKGGGVSSGDDVYLSDLCQDDFDDIRFTTSGGEVELDHWRESYVSGTSAIFWIELDSIPVSPGSADFYIYHGDAVAVSGSNGANTFLLFDHFTGDTLDAVKWEVVDQDDDCTYGVADSLLTVEALNYHAAWQHMIIGSIASYGYGHAFIARLSEIVLDDASHTARVAMANFVDENSSTPWDNAFGTLMTHHFTESADATTYVDLVADVFVDGELVQGGRKAGETKLYKEEIVLDTIATTVPTTNLPLLFVAQAGSAAGPTARLKIDWAAVRNYASPEPTWGAWGEQEGEGYPPSLTGYGYRKLITITGTAAGAQGVYQMRLTIHEGAGADSGNEVYLNSHCQADFDDIRFAKNDGTTQLDHWRESYVSGTSAIFWIEFLDIPASPTTITFYIYYGKADAASGSNGGDTFPFFDHFPGVAIDAAKWEVVDQDTDCTYSVAGSLLMVQALNQQATWQHMIIGAKTSYGYGYAIMGLLTEVTTDDASHTVRFLGGTFADVVSSMPFTQGFGTIMTHNYTEKDDATTYSDLGADDFVTGDVIQVGRIADESKLYKEDTVLDTITTTVPVGSLPIMIMAQAGNEAGITARLKVDWVAVRNYASAEPTWGAWGAEEELGNTPTVITNSATNIVVPNATLWGNITATGGGGTCAERGFDWGETEAYGSSWTESVGSYGTGVFSHIIAGLVVGKTYHFRAKALNDSGWGYGADMSFNTQTGNWLSGYTYRQAITIEGSADGVLTDYQMKVVASKADSALLGHWQERDGNPIATVPRSWASSFLDAPTLIRKDANTIYLYMEGGAGPESAPGERIALMQSVDDGDTWSWVSGGDPINIAGLAPACPAPVKVGDTIYMVYARQTGTEGWAWQMWVASGTDWVNFTPIDKIVTETAGKWDNDCTFHSSKPWLKDGIWHIFYTGRNIDETYGIGHVTTTEASFPTGWTKQTVDAPLWSTSQVQGRPHISEIDGTYYMIYRSGLVTGGKLYYRTSTDLNNWGAAVLLDIGDVQGGISYWQEMTTIETTSHGVIGVAPGVYHWGAGQVELGVLDNSFSVTLGGNCQDDFDDVRFTKADGITELDYWLESYVSGDHAYLWVEVDTIATAPAETVIYIYYDKAAGTSASSGTFTFPLFDPFDGVALDTNIWEVVDQDTDCTYSVAGGNLVMGTTGQQAAWQHMAIGSIASYGYGYAFLAPITALTADAYHATKIVMANFSEANEPLPWDNAFGHLLTTYFSSEASDIPTHTSLGMRAPEVGEVIGGGRVAGRVAGFVGNSKSAVITSNVPTGAYPLIFLVNAGNSAGSGELQVSWAAVRKYTYPEPRILTSAGGGEEVPTVQTNAATLVRTNAATLHGLITDTGASAILKIGFDWGLTDAYGSSWDSATLTPFEHPIDTLAAATPYHFRAKAQNTDGWGYGADTVFTTTSVGIVSGEAVELTGTTATLQGTLTDMGGYTPIYLFFQYGASVACDTTTAEQTVTSVGGFTGAISGLSPGQTYYFRAAARYDVIQYVYGDIHTFTTAPVTPSAPTDFAAVSSAGQINLSWRTGTGATNTLVRYSESTYPATVTNGSLVYFGPATAIVHTEGVVEGVTYYYRAWGEISGTYSEETAITTGRLGTAGEPGIDPPDTTRIEDAKILNSYLESGDQLIIISYKLIYNEATPIEGASEYFSFQVIVGTAIKAQVPVRMWGYRPGSIYLSPSSAISLGSSMTIKLIGNANKWDTPPEAEYIVTTGDWLGSNLPQIDPWVISLAENLQSYYSTEMVVYSPSGTVLSDQGGTIFNMGIPGLSTVRPNLFKTSMGYITPDGYFVHEDTLQPDLEPAARLGPYVSGILDDWGTETFDEDTTTKNTLGLLVMILFAVVVVGVGLMVGFVPAIGACVPILLIGMWTGGISVAIIMVVASIFVMFLLKSIWLRGV